jgi:hypothetical protein
MTSGGMQLTLGDDPKPRRRPETGAQLIFRRLIRNGLHPDHYLAAAALLSELIEMAAEEPEGGQP